MAVDLDQVRRFDARVRRSGRGLALEDVRSVQFNAPRQRRGQQLTRGERLRHLVRRTYRSLADQLRETGQAIRTRMPGRGQIDVGHQIGRLPDVQIDPETQRARLRSARRRARFRSAGALTGLGLGTLFYTNPELFQPVNTFMSKLLHGIVTGPAPQPEVFEGYPDIDFGPQQ